VSHYDELRRKQVHQMLASMPDFVARLDWPRAQIELQRRRALRLLLRVAKEYSPWYRERLRDIDPAQVTEADLSRIPPMTRDDLMDHWDDIVIYPSLTLEGVEAHLRELDQDGFLFDSFHAVSSSGASGRRGVFVYDWDGWIASFAGCARWRLRNRGSALVGTHPVVVSIAAGGASHIHCAINQSFSLGPYHHLPAGLSMKETIRALEQLQPDVLAGFPSVLRELAGEAREGRLTIRPSYLSSTGEPLSAEAREFFEEVWGAHVVNAWAASEALPLGQSCGSGDGLHVSDDLVILEPLDSAGEPAQAGLPSSSALLTNLYNLALPIIRCEIEDRVTLSADPCRCGAAYTLVTEVQGSTRERFVYDGGVVVDPSEIGSVLAREKDVRAYQVRQTEAGAEVRVQSEKPLHLHAVAQRVASALGRGGVDSPSVTVHRVGEIERGPAGKLRRYVPRPASIPPARAEPRLES
jgi:phenylacetate-coenzyme A ligase PaaK-like adenylate-forming protein